VKVVFYGARQAQWLCWIYRSLSGAPEDADWIDATGPLAPAQERALAQADVIALQACGVAAPALDELAPKAERVGFPELALDFLWPFGGQPHLRNVKDDHFPDGPFPAELGDAWLNRRLGARQLPQAIEAEYLALDIGEIVDLDRYFDLTMQRQAELDRASGEDFASRLAASFRTERLFVNPATPAAGLMCELANRLFAKLRAPFALGPDWSNEWSQPELPVHPSVARHFGLVWAQGRTYRARNGERIDFAEYVRRYLAYAEGLERGLRLASAGETAAARPLPEKTAEPPPTPQAFVANPQAGEAATALRRAGALDDADLMSAASAYLAKDWAGAEAAALARLARGSVSADLHAFLAIVRAQRGDIEGRIAALRAALALRPRDAGLQSRLTVALSERGDLAGAIASAEAEVAQSPENPHPRAFLSALLERAGQHERARAELQRTLEIVAVGTQYDKLRVALNQRRAALDRPQG
jgi:Flp pilus assembly protein TadD